MNSTEVQKKSVVVFVAAMLTVYLVWGSTYLAMRVCVETLPPFLMAGFRFLAAGGILWLCLVAMGRFSLHGIRQYIDAAIVGGFLLLGGNGLVSWSVQKIPSGITTIILSLTPLFMVLGEWIVYRLYSGGGRGSKPNAGMFAGMALATAGLVILVTSRPASDTQQPLDLVCVGTLLLACMSWVAGSMYSRYTSQPAAPLSAAAIQMIFGGLVMIGFAVCVGELDRISISSFTVPAISAWLYLVFFGSLAGFNCYIWLMQNYSPAIVSTYSYVNPIVAVFLGWWILNESISPQIFFSALLVVAGVAILTMAKYVRLPRKSSSESSAISEPNLLAEES